MQRKFAIDFGNQEGHEQKLTVQNTVKHSKIKHLLQFELRFMIVKQGFGITYAWAIKNINSLEQEQTSLRNSKTEGRKYYTVQIQDTLILLPILHKTGLDIRYQYATYLSMQQIL